MNHSPAGASTTAQPPCICVRAVRVRPFLLISTLLVFCLGAFALADLRGVRRVIGTGKDVDTTRVSRGRVEVHFIASREIGERRVDVWLPEQPPPESGYPVLYCNDGQMLFDAGHGWNGLEWGMDETAGRMIAADSLPAMIIVGIWNGGENRRAEYFPERALARIAPPWDARMLALMPRGPRADAYLRFIIHELKPLIDSLHPTNRGAFATAVCGASTGALGALYALCEYPDVFSHALCLSTHWTGVLVDNDAIPEALFGYFLQRLPASGRHAVYFDRGTRGLDSLYARHQTAADELFIQAGLLPSASPVYEGDDHSEQAWSRRLPLVLQWLASRLRNR